MTIRTNLLTYHVPTTGGKPIASFELYYPRAAIHEEFLTHRALSRNAASSRATPIQAMIKQVMDDPALPIRMGTNGKGMQDHGAMSPEDAEAVKAVILSARDGAVAEVSRLLRLNVVPHKQIANLYLRPWEHITVVVTATDWSNFFGTRRTQDAKPEFYELADQMWKALRASEPVPLAPGEWHLPYIHKHELASMNAIKDPVKRAVALENLKKVSAARCARTSYKNHRGKTATFAEDVELYDFLVAKNHPSPLEHQATPDTYRVAFDPAANSRKRVRRIWDNPELHGNLSGYIQHRKQIPGENITDYNPED